MANSHSDGEVETTEREGIAIDGLPLSRYPEPYMCACSQRSAWRDGDGENPIRRCIPVCMDCGGYIGDDEAERVGHAVVLVSAPSQGNLRYACVNCRMHNVPAGAFRLSGCRKAADSSQMALRLEHLANRHPARTPRCGLCFIRERFGR